MTIEWRKVAGQMRADLDRAALNENPRLVLAVLIKATLMKGRTSVVLPDRESLCALLGIAKQHMKRVWEEIETARIATFRKVELGWECILVADASQWACDFIYTREQVNQWVAFVDRVPGQAQAVLLAPEPNLRQALAETAAESASNKKCYPPPPVSGPPVTKLVTPQPADANRLPLNAFKVQGSKPDPKLLDIEPLTENNLVDRCRLLFGPKIMEVYGGNWRLRARENPGKLDRVLNDTAAAQKEGRIKTVPAAYANDAWGRFK